MYSVQVHTVDSNADYGTNIPSTDKLKTFLCALDFTSVTHMEINYYRELSGPVLPAPITEPVPVVEAPPVVKSSDWEPDDMGLPL